MDLGDITQMGEDQIKQQIDNLQQKLDDAKDEVEKQQLRQQIDDLKKRLDNA